jgi:hypothetical protein
MNKNGEDVGLLVGKLKKEKWLLELALLIIVIASLEISVQVNAFLNSTSSNYKIPIGEITSGSNISSSNYENIVTVGETEFGKVNNSNNKVCIGYSCILPGFNTETCLDNVDCFSVACKSTHSHSSKACCDSNQCWDGVDCRGQDASSDDYLCRSGTWKQLKITVDTDKQAYNSSETVTASGYFTAEGESLPNKNVTVDFINSTNQIVQSRDVITNLGGDYSDTYTLADLIRSGTWKVNVTGKIGAVRIYNSTAFDVYGATVGQQTHSISSYTATTITQDNSESFNLAITWSNQGPDTAIATNVSLTTTSSNITVNSTFEQCGNVLYGSSCVKGFQVIITPKTPPGVYAVNSTVTWKNNNTVINSTTASTSITVTSNPILVVPESAIVQKMMRNRTKTVGNFTLNSTGNDVVNNINYQVVSGDLPQSWITFMPSPIISQIIAGSKTVVKVNVSAPADSLGFYYANISVTSLNGGSDWLWLNVTVGTVNVTAEAGGPYTVTTTNPTVIIVGNVTQFDGPVIAGVNVNVDVYSGGTLRATNSAQTSSSGKYSVTFDTLGTGTYTVNASTVYESSNVATSTTFKVIESIRGCILKTIVLSGVAIDTDTGQSINSGTVKISINENGDEFSTGFSNGAWRAEFNTCVITGKTYTVAVQLIDSSTGKSSWSQTQFIAP